MFMEKKRLITTNDNYSYKLEQVPELVGSETASARRVRKHRENKKALQCNTGVTKCIGDIDIDIETSFTVSCKLIKILVVVYFINETKSYGYSFKIHMT